MTKWIDMCEWTSYQRKGWRTIRIMGYRALMYREA